MKLKLKLYCDVAESSGLGRPRDVGIQTKLSPAEIDPV